MSSREISLVVATGLLVLAATVAAVLGRRWRLAALGAGGELRQHEQQRVMLWRARRGRDARQRVWIGTQGELIRERAWPEQVPALPMTADGRALVPLGEGMHLYFVGATGAGKTTSARRWLLARGLADHPLFAEDSKVVIVWGVFHRDRDVWGADADLFRPDRWLETTSAQRRNYNPFGSGAQACVAKHYASHGGRVMIKRILDRSEFGFVKPAATTDDVGTDRGYFRGPDPDTALLRFTPRRAREGVCVPVGN